MAGNGKWQMLKEYSFMALPTLIVMALAVPFGVITKFGIWSAVSLSFLLIWQNVSFTIVSRARQMSSIPFHMVAAIFSNGFWIFVFSALVARYNNPALKFWYILCTTVGSVSAHYVSMHHIEKSKNIRGGSLVTKAEFDEAVSKLQKKIDEMSKPEKFQSPNEGQVSLQI